MEKMKYEAPQVEIVEVAVEKGFALSGLGISGNPASNDIDIL